MTSWPLAGPNGPHQSLMQRAARWQSMPNRSVLPAKGPSLTNIWIEMDPVKCCGLCEPVKAASQQVPGVIDSGYAMNVGRTLKTAGRKMRSQFCLLPWQVRGY